MGASERVKDSPADLQLDEYKAPVSALAERQSELLFSLSLHADPLFKHNSYPVLTLIGGSHTEDGGSSEL